MYFKKKYLIVGFTVLLLTTTFLFKSINWKDRFNNWVNQKIVHTGWEMKIEDLVGSFYGTTCLENVIFSHSLGESTLDIINEPGTEETLNRFLLF